MSFHSESIMVYRKIKYKINAKLYYNFTTIARIIYHFNYFEFMLIFLYNMYVFYKLIWLNFKLNLLDFVYFLTIQALNFGTENLIDVNK